MTEHAAPPRWRLERLKWSTTGVTNGVWGEEPNGVDDIPCARVADFDRVKLLVSGQLPTLRAVAERERANRVLRRGDLLIEKSGGGDNQPVGCVVSYDGEDEAVCSNFIGRMPPAPQMHPRYWAYVHAWIYSTRQNVVAIKQTTGIQNLDIEAYLDIRVLYPSTEEQASIAKFLDLETSRVDSLVAAKQRVLDLLAEKRKAIIATAVTRGLDPKVKLRDSGVPWLGEIPAHWTQRRLRHISPAITVGVVVNPSTYVTDDGVPFLYGSDITEEGIRADGARRLDPDVSRTLLAKTCLRPGDVVTVRVGAPGVTAVVPPELDGSNCASVMLVRGASTFDSHWLAHAMNSPIGRAQVEVVQYGAAQEQFNIRHAVDFWFAVPPLEEQRSIVEHIARGTAKLDAVRAATERTIALLKERRSALIAAAVTGELDVEKAA